MAELNLLTVIVKNRDKILFEDKAIAITSIDEKGVFDILAQHSNFICVIKEHIIIHKIDKTTLEIPCREGVIQVNSNLVKIFIDILPKKNITSVKLVS